MAQTDTEQPAPEFSSVQSLEVQTSLTGKGSGGAPDKAFRYLALAAGLGVLLILAAIAVSTTKKAWPAFQAEGFGLIFSNDWNPGQGKFGGLAMVYGTLVISAIALVLAVPVSIGIALFVTEVAPRRMRSSITTVIDLLAAIPSVVFGLWAFQVLRLKLPDFFNHIADIFGSVPGLDKVFKTGSTGLSFATAGMILALMIVPIITSVTREVFLTVPRNDKDGALALGATRWEMIRSVVLPHSTGGMTGAVMLGLGRAMGETIAVALVIGASPQIVANLFSQGEAMPSIIARNLNEASGTFQAALIGLGVVLFAITIVINVAARRIVVLVDQRLKGT